MPPKKTAAPSTKAKQAPQKTAPPLPPPPPAPAFNLKDTVASIRVGPKSAVVKDHYDAVVASKSQESPEEAAQNRKNGEAYSLKRFHNDIKYFLIDTFAHQAPALLDLCCGQGGDLQKWMRSGIKYVKGIDISANALDEARRRYAALSMAVANGGTHRNGPMPSIEFQHSNELGSGLVRAGASPYSVVTCFFAIQYFFKDEGMLHALFRNVAENLRPGGYFVGTCPDGKEVMKLIGEGAVEYVTPRVSVSREWKGEHQAFGSSYTMSINDTVTASTQATVNLEYLAFENVLVLTAAKYGLKPVAWASVPSHNKAPLDSMLRPASSKHGLFRHFRPNPKLFGEEDDDLMDASSTYAAFAFQKT